MDDKAIASIMKATGNENKHNWLYSFMMATEGFGASYDVIYLVAYCKQCDNTLSVPVSRDALITTPTIARAYVPKYGCEPVE